MIRPAVAALARVLVVAAGLGQLRNPASLVERAPDTFLARFDTTKGVVVISVQRAWAPIGADRFYNLVKSGFYDECRFFRVLDGVMAQVGLHGTPDVQAAWDAARIRDDPGGQSNRRGSVSFATAGPDRRSTQFFVNLKDNPSFDRQGAVPFGTVTSGMEHVDAIYSGYGDGAPRGSGPDQRLIRADGNAYLTRAFPKLDYVRHAAIEKPVESRR